MPDVEITINRAPVLMRWVAVVAERRGEPEQGVKRHVDLLRRAVPAGTRAQGAAGALDVEDLSGPA